MRIIVMGTGPFAVPAAASLLAQGIDIPLVVTRPVSKPRPKKLPPRPVAEWAERNNLPLFEPASINSPDAIELLKGYQADLFFVCDYGQILSKACLSATRLGGINLHGSLLPKHRGAAPVQWSLLAGDTSTGVTVIHMTPSLDAGPALSIRETQVFPDENAGQLEPRLAILGVDATLEAIGLLESWDGHSPIGQTQVASLATKAPRFSKLHGQLDFRLPAGYLARLIRSCQPWPGTYADLVFANGNPMRLLVRAARHVADSTGFPRSPIAEARDILASQLGLDWPEPWSHLLGVQTGDGMLLISRVQPAGKREMSVAEFVRGHKITPQSRFLLPEPPVVQLID